MKQIEQKKGQLLKWLEKHAVRHLGRVPQSPREALHFFVRQKFTGKLLPRLRAVRRVCRNHDDLRTELYQRLARGARALAVHDIRTDVIGAGIWSVFRFASVIFGLLSAINRSTSLGILALRFFVFMFGYTSAGNLLQRALRRVTGTPFLLSIATLAIMLGGLFYYVFDKNISPGLGNIVTSEFVLGLLTYMVAFAVAIFVMFGYLTIDARIFFSRNIDIVVAHQLVRIYAVSDNNEPWTMADRRMLLEHLETCANLFEKYVPKYLKTGDPLTEGSASGSWRRIAAGLRELKMWVIFPQSTTHAELGRELRTSIQHATRGHWHYFRKSEVVNKSRTRILEIIKKMSRIVIVSIAPTVIVVLWHESAHPLPEVVYQKLIFSAFAVGVFYLLLVIDPSAGERFKGASTMLGIITKRPEV